MNILEHMGGGLSIFAEAITGKKGVEATKTFMEGMKKGLYDSAKWLPIVAERMKAMAYQSGVVDKSTKNLESSVNRLSNAWFELMSSSEENGLGGVMARVIDFTTEKLRDMDKWLKENKATIDGIGKAFDFAFAVAKMFFNYLVSDTGVLLLVIALASKAGKVIKAMLPMARLLPYIILAGLFTEIKSTLDGADTIFTRMGVTAKEMAAHFEKYGQFYGTVGGALVGAKAGRVAGPWGALTGGIAGALTGGNLTWDSQGQVIARIKQAYKENGARIWQNAEVVNKAIGAGMSTEEMYRMGATPYQLKAATGDIPRAATNSSSVVINGDINVNSDDPKAVVEAIKQEAAKHAPKGKQ